MLQRRPTPTPLGKGRAGRRTHKWGRVWGGVTSHLAGKVSASRASLPRACVGLSLAGLATAPRVLALRLSVLTWRAREEVELLRGCEAPRAQSRGRGAPACVVQLQPGSTSCRLGPSTATAAGGRAPARFCRTLALPFSPLLLLLLL